MKYYIDTEFYEDHHRPWFGRRRHSIDLISIGIVNEQGREYYAICNEFDVNQVWNKYEIKTDFGKPQGLGDKNEYWLRDNVLWPLVHDAVTRYSHGDDRNRVLDGIEGKGKLNALKWVIKKYGKSKAQIAQEILHFIWPPAQGTSLSYEQFREQVYSKPEFWGYYADYDWVVFCSLFGRMIDLPKGFPMYCRDLKQLLDYRIENVTPRRYHKPDVDDSFEVILRHIKSCDAYPKQDNAHNALDDAKWNKKLHEFIINPKNYTLS